jgi:hypothetical protein
MGVLISNQLLYGAVETGLDINYLESAKCSEHDDFAAAIESQALWPRYREVNKGLFDLLAEIGGESVIEREQEYTIKDARALGINLQIPTIWDLDAFNRNYSLTLWTNNPTLSDGGTNYQLHCNVSRVDKESVTETDELAGKIIKYFEQIEIPR